MHLPKNWISLGYIQDKIIWMIFISREVSRPWILCIPIAFGHYKTLLRATEKINELSIIITRFIFAQIVVSGRCMQFLQITFINCNIPTVFEHM